MSEKGINRTIQIKEKVKSGNFDELGRENGIHPIIARVIRNRGIEDSGFHEYLYGNVDSLLNPHLLKDGDTAASILEAKIKEGAHIRVIGDYDVDGVMSSYILTKGLKRVGGCVSVLIPHRINDGYGLNRNLIDDAHSDGVDTIITCDNGISAKDEIAIAKDYGMTVIVTDHHRITNGIPEADAVVNPHQEDCQYPYKELCGAAVAWKVLTILFERMGLSETEAYSYLENVAFATVADIMPLTGENRILVREGLRRIRETQNPGMRALISQNNLEPGVIKAYHFGFVLGPCINATGRLDTAKTALNLFLAESNEEAVALAASLVELNESRKALTQEGVELAFEQYENSDYDKDPVIVLFLPEVHESIAGLIASKVKERYYKPTIILTRGEECIKGSGRSIDGYSLDVELMRVSDLLLKFGGHPKAAGLSLLEENIDLLRKRLNEQSPLSVDQEIETMYIDAVVKPEWLTEDLVDQMACLDPLGNENAGPLFGAKNLGVHSMMRIGKNRNMLKLYFRGESGTGIEGIYFGDADAFIDKLKTRYSKEQIDAAFCGEPNELNLSVVYTPSVNEFNGNKTLQMQVKYYI